MTRVSAPGSLAPPALPAADRVDLDERTLLSAAVVLDVLASATRRLDAQATVLADLAQVAVEIRGHGAEDVEARLEALVVVAAGDAGARRAEVATTLAALAGDGATSPTPATVAAALRRIEAATRIAVREARAVLEARGTPDVHQA
jgi:hypothetical protein